MTGVAEADRNRNLGHRQRGRDEQALRLAQTAAHGVLHGRIPRGFLEHMRQMIGADTDGVADVLQGKLLVKVGVNIVLDLPGNDIGSAAHGIPLSLTVLPDDQQQLGDKRRRQIVAGFGRAFGVGCKQAPQRSAPVRLPGTPGNTPEKSGSLAAVLSLQYLPAPESRY